MSEIERLENIVKTLRSENGCPWDRAQTHGSLKPECIEEASEVVCGINIYEKTGDAENLKEELGDLLLQVMFHSVIAEEEGLFTFEDVCKVVCDKMERRHPHVFAGVTFASNEERHAAWESIKKEEKAGREWQEEYLKDAFKESAELIQKAEGRKWGEAAHIRKACERVTYYEDLYDKALQLRNGEIKESVDGELQNVLAKLSAYLESPEWKTDFRLDEEGKLPKDLKRGVLAEDKIYDLLEM